MCQPLCQRDVFIVRGREDLKKDKVSVAGVFYEVRYRLINVTYIAGLEVHGPSPATGGKDRHASFTLHVILPLVLIRMPMELAQAAGLERNDSRSDIRRRKVLLIDDLYLATFRHLGRLHLVRKERECIGNRTRSCFDLMLLFRQGARQFLFEDKKLLGRDICKGRCRYVEVLG